VPRRTPYPVALFTSLVVTGLLLAAASSRAQGVAGPVSLRRMTADADAVVRARITVAGSTIEAAGYSYPVVHAEVLENLKGPAAPGTLIFALVGNGAAAFVPGDDVLVFLQDIERVAALAASPLQTRLRYVAIPNAGEKVLVTPAEGAALMQAVRRYAALERIPDPEGRAEALRLLTLELLKSGTPTMVATVMRDFAPGNDAAALTLADLPALVPTMEDPRVPIGTRIALVVELERRGLIFGPARWVRLLRTSRGTDLLAVVRAAGEHPSTGVNAHLVPLLGHRDLAIATAAATALGIPGNVEVVRALATSLGRDDVALRLAALRSLGRIGTQSARQALELAAARHPDLATRQRAEHEAIALARRHGTTLAPTLGFTGAEAAIATAPVAPESDTVRTLR
jgi:hypothetical protein